MNARMDPKKIADEAIGQRPESAIPDAAREQMTAEISERAIRWRAASAGPNASIAERSAEAMGEQSGGAYAHQNATPRQVQLLSSATARRAEWWPRMVGDLPFISAAAIFAIGYGTALLIHRR